MGEYAASVDPREGLFQFGDFRGLRNNVGADAFAPSDLSVALNVDIDDALGVRRRKGFSSPAAAAVDRGLWADGSVCLGVGGDALKLVHPDYTTKTLRTGLAADRALSYTAVADRVFWANGVETGVVQDGTNRSWGLTVPGIPIASPASGSLTPGTYQYAVTYLRQDGQESGAPRAGVIDLVATGGIALSNISVSDDPTVVYKAVYLSATNGETLFAVGMIENAATTFLIDEQRRQSSPLMTQFLSPPPAGDFIAEFRGHLLVAVGDRLYPSEPYAPELFDLRKGIGFGEAITLVAPMPDGSGVYIGTLSKVTWVQGASPSEWVYRTVSRYGAVPGTLSYGDGDLLGDGQSTGEIAFFATTRGLCAGRTGGALLNLTEARFAYPIQPRGAGVVRRHRGMAQYLCTMQGPETAGNVAV